MGECGEYLMDSEPDEADEERCENGAKETAEETAGTTFSPGCKEGAEDGQKQSGLVCDLCGQVLKMRGRMKHHRDSKSCQQRAQQKRRRKAEGRPPAETGETAGTTLFSCEHCRATWPSKAALDGHRTHCKAPPPKEKELNGATEPFGAAAEESFTEQPGGLVALGAEQGGREEGREEGGEGGR